MRKLNSFLTLASISTLLLSACSAVKNMDEMKDTTKDMKNITQDMSTTTNGMAKTTEKMDATSLGIDITNKDLYEDNRQGTAMDYRSGRLEAMNKNSDQLGKVSEAAKYFMSFEYQLFKQHGTDTPEKLEYMKFNAVQEFLREIFKYSTGAFGFQGYDQVNMFPVTPTRVAYRNDLANLNALVVAMHLTNPNYDKNSQRDGFAKISMMDLLEEAVPHFKRIDSGEDDPKKLSPFITEFHDYEPLVYWLIQVRHNFLATMVIAKFSHLMEKGTIDQGLWVLNPTGFFRAPKIVTDLQEFNSTHLSSVGIWLEEANRDVELLKSYGQPVVYDAMTIEILKNIEIKTPSGDKNPKLAHRNEVKADMVKLLNKYRGQ